MKLIWDSPWYIILLCLLAGAAVAALLYLRNRVKELAAPLRLTMAALRFVSVSLCCLLLAGILLKQVHNEEQDPIVVIATDNSSSMLGGKDSVYVRDQLATDLEALERQLAGRYDVATLYFDSDARENKPDQFFSGKETDINELLHKISNNFANQNVGAVVLVSDGIYNKGSNPLYAAATLGFPVYAVGAGDTTEQTDVLVRRVDHNQIAYRGNNFPVVVQVAAKKAAGRRISVQLMQGQSVKASSEITVTSPNFSMPVTFTLNASAPGLQKYRARVVTTEPEHNARNNEQDFVVEVLDNKEKILLLAHAPHPDIGAIREAIAGNTSYELEVAYLDEETPPLQQFNLVIIHGYSSQQASIIQKCSSNRLPYWIVNPSAAEGLPGVRITTGLNRFNEVEAYVDETFGYFNLSAELRRFIADAPAITTFFGNYQLPQGSSPLLLQRLGSVETNHPLLYFNGADETRFAVLIGEGLWRWKLRDYAMHGSHRLFAELISKCIQYLAAREDKSFFRLNAPRIIADNETLEMSAELYNKSYEPVNAGDVVVSLVNEREQRYNYTFSKTGRAYRLNAGTLPAGEYRYKASVSHGGESFTREGVIIVKETVAEQANVVADHGLLRQVAMRSGGSFFTSGQLEELGRHLSAEGNLKTVVYSQTITSPLIDEEILFYLLIVLLAIEWLLRKRYMII